MGILNVTPDSFSDGGQYPSVDEAIERGITLRDQGAVIVDVGGESTRPGAKRITVREEQSRIMPVISGLVAEGVPVSVDTMNADTAYTAAQAGASVINDVSGGLADPAMYRVIVETGVKYVAMHWRAQSAVMGSFATYNDVVADVRRELKGRIAEMTVAGIAPENVILDPGLGFAKTPEHNWQLLAGLARLTDLGYRVLIGASRKRFLEPFGQRPDERDEATAVISVIAAQSGAWGVRVHDVPSTAKALGVLAAIKNGNSNA